MLVPLSWLREFTPYQGGALELGDRLTMLGLELEDIINPFENISDIVVGYVASCSPHPDSDHLHCCKVDIGSGELLDIVCGAPNVAAGQKVAVAPVGAVLPDGLKIKKAKLRGQPSMGMICSDRELGLSEDHSGILVLPESSVVGHKLVDSLGLEKEVLELSITPNRGDCLSVLGIARETAAAFNLPFAIPELPLITDPHLDEIEVPLEIGAPDLCHLYSGRIITGMTVAPSSVAMRCRLISVGIRPVSNIVDITNYILFEVGQPLHSFDYNKLEGGKIVVRRARAGEKLITLDGRERALSSDDLCICDAWRPVGLAGIMGGENTEITSETQNVFLESAVFAPEAIRRASRRLGLISEASFRFERGIDQERSVWALDRACSLLASLCGGQPRKGISLAVPRPFRGARIKFRLALADALLGEKLPESFDARTLENEGCAIEKDDSATWTVIQPSWRHDLTREADLVEEVGRFYGLDMIKPKLPPILRDTDINTSSGDRFKFMQRLKHWAAGCGLNEVINYSFVGKSELERFDVDDSTKITILNPLSSEQDVLRTLLAPGLLNDLRNNLAQGAQSLKIFETARIFHTDNSSETGAWEKAALGILLYGLLRDPCPASAMRDMGYADLKGLLEHLFAHLHLRDARWRLMPEPAWLNPAVGIMLGDENVGFLGRVRPAIAELYHARKDCWIAELDISILARLEGGARVKFVSLPIYPASRRDLTLKIEHGTTAADIFDKLSAMNIPLLEGAVLLDNFEPEGSETRNLTIRLTFRHPGRTLKDEEVDREREKVAQALTASAGVSI